LDDAGMHSDEEIVSVPPTDTVVDIDNDDDDDDNDNDVNDKTDVHSQPLSDVVVDDVGVQTDDDDDDDDQNDDADGLLDLVNVVRFSLKTMIIHRIHKHAFLFCQVLLNPDYELAAFTYDIVSVRRYCEHITVKAKMRVGFHFLQIIS
jgi:hypothetical protein